MAAQSQTHLKSSKRGVSTQEELTAMVVEFYQEMSALSVRTGRPVSVRLDASIMEESADASDEVYPF